MNKRIFITAIAILSAALMLAGCASLSKVKSAVDSAVSEGIAEFNEKMTLKIDDTIGESAGENDTEALGSDTDEKNTVGASVDGKDFNYKLVSVAQNVKGEYIEAEKGKVFIHCQIELTNVSDEEETFSAMNTEAYCDGYNLDYSISASMANPNGDNEGGGTIAPGKKLLTTLSYEVPEDWKEIEINIDEDIISKKDDKIVFVIHPEDVK